MKKIIVLVFMSFSFFSTIAQTDPAVMKEAMNKLSFMAGQWSGSGWMYLEGGVRAEFTQTEDIRFELDGEALVIKGLGKSKDAASGKERTVHHALAMVTYNPGSEDYDFRSYAVGRGSGNYKGRMIAEHTFEWTLNMPQGKVRYIITLNEQGQWFEIGEFARGDSWFKIFEMTLNKLEE